MMRSISKNTFFFILSFLLLLCLSCKSTQQGVAAQDTFVPTNLEDLLRRKGGLMITGTGDNLEIRIRGNTSIHGENRPLFMLDGIPIGRDYNSVNSSINPLEIQSIRIIPAAKAGIYGARGSNGVIEMRLKKA